MPRPGTLWLTAATSAAVVLLAVAYSDAAKRTPSAAACTDIDHTHQGWTRLLQRHVRAGRVDYRALSNNPAPLNAYLEHLQGACRAQYTSWSEAQQIAFWLNAYNAYTVALIVEHYPLESIRDIGLLPGAAFREEFIPLRATTAAPMSLDAIEHDTLREDFDEPRIHFALVCGARSCPPLAGSAYRADTLHAQLDAQARTFLRNRAKNRFDADSRTLYLSAIFKWFGDDFTDDADDLAAYVARYMPTSQAQQIQAAPVGIEYLDYDWSLNSQAKP